MPAPTDERTRAWVASIARQRSHTFQSSVDDVLDCAEFLGMDLRRDIDLLWIAGARPASSLSYHPPTSYVLHPSSYILRTASKGVGALLPCRALPPFYNATCLLMSDVVTCTVVWSGCGSQIALCRQRTPMPGKSARRMASHTASTRQVGRSLRACTLSCSTSKRSF